MDALSIKNHKPMTTEFALDLRLARRKAGLTQRDTAHLLGLDPAKLSQLEHGKRLPTLTEICTLSLIFGRSFESLFCETMEIARHDLRDRLKTIPSDVRRSAATMNREASLSRLGRQLKDQHADHGA